MRGFLGVKHCGISWSAVDAGMNILGLSSPERVRRRRAIWDLVPDVEYRGPDESTLCSIKFVSIPEAL